jgi:uncharacterized protein (DUF952 family)
MFVNNNSASEKEKNTVSEPLDTYGFIHLSEDERLRIDMKRPYKEKLQLFTKMLRRNKLLDKAKFLPTK